MKNNFIKYIYLFYNFIKLILKLLEKKEND
jgi:hypothetical protein